MAGYNIRFGIGSQLSMSNHEHFSQHIFELVLIREHQRQRRRAFVTVQDVGHRADKRTPAYTEEWRLGEHHIPRLQS